MGSLALRPGNSLTILFQMASHRLQDVQFPSFLLFKLRGLDSYPGGTFTHCSCQPSLDAHFPVLIWLDERIGELAPINVQFALSGSGIHDRGTPGISYA